MAYMHGIRVQENPTTLPVPVKNEAGVPVIFGTAPVNLAKDPENATNKLFLCESFADAVDAVGYSSDYANYTLCQAMDAFFKAFGVGPIVICNVLDPTTHNTTFTETIAVSDGVAVSTNLGVLKSNLVVTGDEATLTLDTDYALSFNDEGYLVVTILTGEIGSIGLSGKKLNPAGVTASDVIGSYSPSTGVETGLELMRKVYPMLNVIPSFIVAPGWSHLPTVGLAMAAKCDDVNGLFKCECLVDIDTTAASHYTDVEDVKNNNAFTSEHMICLWPMVKYAGKVMYYSAIYAAMASYTDVNNDNVPSLSPSNKLLNVTATVISTGDEINLDQSQANELNAVGVVTACNSNGIKSWGNNTAAYPGTIDPKDRWIACRRFFSWWGNTFINTYMEKVDDPANYRLIESIVDSENVRGNSMVSMGKCAGIRMEYRQEDNTLSDVIDGKIVFRQYLAPYTPAEDILNILEFDPTMIEAALGGETE